MPTIADKETLLKSSIIIAKHKNAFSLDKILSEINSVFSESDSNYVGLTVNDYRELMFEAQEKINNIDATRLICNAIFDDLTAYLDTDKFLIQSNIYLRASRPQKPQSQENIGWHRETFYGSNMERSVNVWTPFRGVNSKNAIQYIPETQLIPDVEIHTVSKDDSVTERFSTGHKLGFQYSPKEIISGVDFSAKKTMPALKGTSAIFSGNLIHGAAENDTDLIRFSGDFRIIREADYSKENKQYHFSSGKPYFVTY